MLVNDALLEGKVYHNSIPENTKRVYKAYCGNCGQNTRSDLSSRITLKHKPNAKKGQSMCPDCTHALFWRFERVKLNHGELGFTPEPHDLKGPTMCRSISDLTNN